MGTNFYIVPKKNPEVYDNLNKLLEHYNKKLQEIVEEYKKAVKNELKVLSQDENIKDIVSYDNQDSFLDNMTQPYLWNYELPELHIGKRSLGWKFLFQTSDYWKNTDELIDFYNKHKSYMIIIDEYNREYKNGIEDFIKEEVQPTYERPGNTSHIEYSKIHEYFDFNNYYIKDKKYGYEFDTREFS